MKKTLIALVAAFAACVSAAAQSDFTLGPKVGFSMSWLPQTVLVGNEKVMPHNGFYAGVGFDWEFAENVIFGADLVYDTKGHSDRVDSPEGVLERYNLNLGYVKMPLYLGAKFFGDKFWVQAGPSLNFLTNATSKHTVLDKVTKTNVYKVCNPFVIALDLTLSYMITDELSLDVRFDWGASRTFKKGSDSYFSESIFKNTKSIDRGHNVGVMLGLSYQFAL